MIEKMLDDLPKIDYKLSPLGVARAELYAKIFHHLNKIDYLRKRAVHRRVKRNGK